MPVTIGQRLKQAREARRLPIEKAAEATRVRLPYLQALENDDYSVMVSAAQGRGFLRLYAGYLGLNLEEIVSDVKAASATAQANASPAPVADAPPEPTPPAESAASASDGSTLLITSPKPARPGFWSRLLRRSAPATLPEIEPEPVAPMIVDAPSPAPAPVEETAVTLVETALQPAKHTRKKKLPTP